MWAFSANTIAASFWTLYNILADPALSYAVLPPHLTLIDSFKCRGEEGDRRDVRRRSDLHQREDRHDAGSGFALCVLFSSLQMTDAAAWESMRQSASIVLLRTVLEDTEIQTCKGDYKLRKGLLVLD